MLLMLYNYYYTDGVACCSFPFEFFALLVFEKLEELKITTKEAKVILGNNYKGNQSPFSLYNKE